MQPESIPFIICSLFCMLPFLAGLLGYFIPRILANKLPAIQSYKYKKSGRNYTVIELSNLSKQEIKESKKADK